MTSGRLMVDDDIYGQRYFCGILGIDALAKEHSRHKNCPLVEVPTPHGRLIDADDIDIITVVYTNRGTLKRIDAPIIIEAEE